MTKLTDTILTILTVSSIYLVLYVGAIPTPAVIHDEILPVLPWWALVSYGCYALFSLGYGVFTLNDKEDKYEELLSQISEARGFLEKNGVDVK
ncbi:DEKNAAC100832 [Brettanomyces naardenensis]|uniref:Dolichol-phosphate mannosyltransferase subunit 3 n=1 Tax=Brettanomyces naardenensis TaxID=13370 RepID=A0A448YG18_BRENA|nr:DEKNAAC100832 [Brettanomyces naardenensis]